MKVALVVDNPSRDLSGMALLGAELAARGHTAQLVPMNLQRPELPALAPDVAVLPYLRRTANDEVVTRLLDGGIDVLVLDTEGGVIDLDAFGTMLPGDELRGRVARWCTWGENQAEAGVARGWFRPDQVAVTGNPRFDFYSECLRPAALATSDAPGLDAPGPTVLVIGSFPFSNPQFARANELERRMARHGTDRAFVEHELAVDRASLDGTIELVDALVARYPEVSFVVRPHPFERLETYVERLAPSDNLHVIRSGTVDGWLLSSDLVIQPPDCTVGVEAAIVGVPALLTSWLAQIRTFPVVEAACTSVASQDEMLARVGSELAERADTAASAGGRPPLPDAVRRWFGPGDGRNHVRVADEVEAVGAARRGRFDRSTLRRTHHQVDDVDGLARVLATTRSAARLPSNVSFRRFRVDRSLAWDDSGKRFGADDVAHVLGAVADVHGTTPPLVRPAVVARDYDFGYRTGRTVVVEAPPTVQRPVARIGFAEAMLGAVPGKVVSQGEILAPLFRAEGYEVHTTSTKPHWAARAVDTAATVLRWRNRVDAVIVGTFSARGFAMADLASAAARAIGARVIFFLHGGNLPAFADEHPDWVARVLERGDVLVAPSRFLAADFEARGWRVEVIPNVVDVARYPFRRRDAVTPRLLWMRKFGDYYAPELAVQVLARLRATHPEATLTMAGPDDGRLEATRQLVTELGLDGAVSFPGFLDMEGKLDAFDRHDVFLNTNRVDNTPVSVLEAGAFGLPVVATEAGGVAHLLSHGEDALLVAPDDADAMAAAVRRLLDDAALAGRLSDGGRALAERHAWPAVLDGWERLLAEVVS